MAMLIRAQQELDSNINTGGSGIDSMCDMPGHLVSVFHHASVVPVA